MNGQNFIDFDKLSRAIEALSSMESTVNSEQLDDAFLSMEDYFDYINCNHSECLIYKDTLNSIFTDLDILKNRINELLFSLRKLKTSFSSTEPLVASLDSLKKETSIDPVPIGVTIGATALAGGIGAAIMDHKYEKKELRDASEIELDSYEVRDDYDEEENQISFQDELEEASNYENFDE